MCKEKGFYFLNNDSAFIQDNVPCRILYRDNIHLNAKGGKVLGEHMRKTLNSVLGITQADSNSESVAQRHGDDGAPIRAAIALGQHREGRGVQGGGTGQSHA